MLNGVSGSGDFIRNAPLSVIALPSTADGEDISRIVPMVPHADHTEHDIDIIVTEQGVADLRGTFPRERARELVENRAHPSVREDLRDYLERAAETDGHELHELETAFSWQS